MGVAAVITNGLCLSFSEFVLYVSQNDAGASLCKQTGLRGALTAAGPGDDGGLVF